MDGREMGQRMDGERRMEGEGVANTRLDFSS